MESDFRIQDWLTLYRMTNDRLIMKEMIYPDVVIATEKDMRYDFGRRN